MIGRLLSLAFSLALPVCGLPCLSFGSLIHTMVPRKPCLGAAHLTISTRPLPLSVVHRPRMPWSCAQRVPVDTNKASALAAERMASIWHGPHRCWGYWSGCFLRAMAKSEVQATTDIFRIERRVWLVQAPWLARAPSWLDAAFGQRLLPTVGEFAAQGGATIGELGNLLGAQFAAGKAEDYPKLVSRQGPAHDVPRTFAGCRRDPALGAKRLQCVPQSVGIALAQTCSATDAQKEAMHVEPLLRLRGRTRLSI